MTNRFTEIEKLLKDVIQKYRELYQRKASLTEKELKKEEADINKFYIKEIKRIKKEYPLEEFLKQIRLAESKE